MVSRASGQVAVPSPLPIGRDSLPLPAPRETPMPPAVDDETRTTPVAPKATSGIRWGVALLFLLAIGGGGAAGAWLRLREDDQVAAPVKPAPPPAPAADARALDAAVPDFVTIGIDAEPGGAKVLVDGEERGVTPVDLRVAGSTKPIKIELRRDGYQPLVRELVPDRDRTMKEKLTR
jgi:hypothetical protein